jgi:DNA-binding transcriptional LysR family regulator
MIEIRLLEHALAVANEASFALAAQTLGLSQPALTRSIQSLETQLGVQIFERGHRRIEPTDAGRMFLERARDLLARHVELSQEMGLVRQTESPTLMLVVGPYVAEQVAAHALALASMQFPEIQFCLRIEGWADGLKLLRARECELAVVECSQIMDDAELDVRPLGKNQGYLVVRAGHPLLKKDAASLEQILTYPLVSTGRLPPRLLAPLVQSRAKTGANGDSSFPAVVCEQVSVMREVVANSEAVGMFTLSLIERELATGALVPLPCQIPWLHTQFGIVSRRQRSLSSPALALAELLEQAADTQARRDEEVRVRLLANGVAL